MPIYEYECPKCGVFEAIQKATDKPLKCKPECQEKNCPKKAERLISQSAFHLKGGGWYKTDYASSSSGTGSGKKKASSKSEGTSSSEGESKSDKSAASDSGEKKSLAKVKGEGGGGSGGCGSGCGCH